MRGSFFFALAATLAATTAFAQSSSSSSSTSSTGTSTAALPQPKPRNFKIELFSQTGAQLKSVMDAKGAVSTSNFVGAKIPAGDGKSWSLRQTFSYQFPQIGLAGSNGKTKMGDTYLQYVDGRLPSFEGTTFTGIFRAYLPTGETSRTQTQQYGKLLSWLILSKPLTSKLSLDGQLISTLQINSQDSFMTADGPRANDDFSADPSVGLAYSFNEQISLSQWAGTNNGWTRPILGKGIERSHTFGLTTYLSYAPISQLSMTAYVSNDVNIFNPSTPYQAYRGEDTTVGMFLSSTL